MAIISCPECAQQISDKAEHCIHCGFPLIQSKNINTNEGTALNNFNDLNKLKSHKISASNIKFLVAAIILMVAAGIYYINHYGQGNQMDQYARIESLIKNGTLTDLPTIKDWSIRQYKLIRYSSFNNYLVIAAIKQGVEPDRDYDSITKIFVYKFIGKKNKKDSNWLITDESDEYGMAFFDSLYTIHSVGKSLILADICLGGAHGLQKMIFYQLDISGKLQANHESYEEDGTEHFYTTIVNDSTMTIERNEGVYKYLLVDNLINRSYLSNAQKALDEGAIVAKYVLSNNEISAFETSTYYLNIGESIVFEGADDVSKNTQISGIYSDAWGNELGIGEANRLRDFTYKFNEPGEFHFIIEPQGKSRIMWEDIMPTFTVIVQTEKNNSTFDNSTDNSKNNRTTNAPISFYSKQDVILYLSGKTFYSSDHQISVEISNFITINNTDAYYNLRIEAINENTGIVKGESLKNPDGTIRLYVYPKRGCITSAGESYCLD